jgi:predicted RND superfamily exporter protein
LPARRPLRRRIEDGFSRWGVLLARHAWAVSVAILLASLAIGQYARLIRLDTHPEKFLSPDHAVRLAYEDFKREFGLDNAIALTLRVPDVFDLEFLGRLRALHEELEARVPHLDEVTSLINARSTRGAGSELIVEDLFERWPEDEDALAAIERVARANPLYRGLLISEDATLTTLNVRLTPWSSTSTGEALAGFDDPQPSAGGESHEFLSGTEMQEAVGVVRQVLASHDFPGAEVYLAGDPVMSERLSLDTARNLQSFLSLSLIAIVVVLGLLFRRASGVVLPLLVVALALLTTFGLAGLRGQPMNIAAQLLPTFLLSVGIATAIHTLVIFYQHYDRGAERTAAIAAALGHTGQAVVMTSLTTAAGLLSFNAANLEAVRDLGVFAPLGVLVLLVYCLVLLPALLAIAPIRRRASAQRRGPSPLVRVLLAAGDLAVAHPWAVVSATAALTLLAGVGLRWIAYEHDPMTWFPEDDPIRTSTRVIDREMGGTLSLEVVVDTGRENGLHEPELQRALERLGGAVSGMRGEYGIEVRKTLSIADVTQEIHQALNENRPEFHAIPGDRQLIAQELLLFENSGTDDLEEWVDSQFSRARFSARAVWVAAQHYVDFVPRVKRTFQDALGPGVRVEVTGLLALITTALEEIRWGMIWSYFWSLATITPLMMLMVGSLRGGLVSMIPNLTPIFWVLGWMGWAGIGLDSFTILVGSIASGIAVDDTVHFLHGFYREFGDTGDTRESLRRTLSTTGEALVTTTAVLCCGFLVYSFATMSNIVAFGQLSALTLGLALVAEVLVTPALLALVTRRRQRAPRVHPSLQEELDEIS